MQMLWLPLAEMMQGIQIPAGVYFEQLDAESIVTIVELLRRWYPDIVVGSESRHLDPIFYQSQCQLREMSEDRNIYPLVIRTTDTKEIVAMMTLEKNPAGRQITSPMGAVEPSKRGVGIGQVGPAVLERFGRAIGAEIALYFATLKSVRPQLNAEKHGFRAVGLVRGFDVDAVRPGDHKRVFEILYTKYLGSEADVEIPAWENMTPATQVLYSFLYGKHPEVDRSKEGNQLP